MNFSLRQIRYFVATAQLGQISRAAEQLHVTQSAVTLAVRDLEHELGYPLFRREAHGMELTDDGRQFLTHAVAIEAAVARAASMTRPDPVAGDLTLAATSTVVGYFLPEHIQRLSELHPQLRISVEERSRHEIEAGLLSGEFTLGLLVTSSVVNPQLRTETLVESRRRLWLASGHGLTRQGEVSLRDVAREPLMMLSADEAAESARRYWAGYGLTPQVRLRSASIEAIRSMVALGQGVAIASDMQYRPWSLEGRRVETAILKEPIPPLSVGLAWRKGITFSPAMMQVQGYFRQRFIDPPHRHKPARR